MAEPDPAARRFWIIQLARFGAAIMVVFGALIIGRLIDVPQAVGYVLLVIGAVEFFVVPNLLARKWRSPKS